MQHAPEISVTIDANLLARLRNRDEATLTEVVARCHGGMLRLAGTFVGANHAEEVVQEAWIKALRGFAGLEGRSSLKTWLYAVVVNQAKSFLRTNGRRRGLHSNSVPEAEEETGTDSRFNNRGAWVTPPEPWHEETPEALLAVRELHDRLRGALDTLPIRQKSICLLHDIEGLALEDVCNILEISASNGRVLLHRARKKIWEVVAAYRRE